MIYHYTTFSNAINHIINSGKIKLNLIGNSNDPYEVKIGPPTVFQNNSPPGSPPIYPNVYEEIKKYLFSKIRTVSFVNGDDGADRDQHGWDNLPMWAHYGENGYGVCIGFDEKELELEIKENKEIIFHKCYKVDYPENISSCFNPPNLIKYNRNDTIELMRGKVWDNACKHFYRKNKKWGYENEFRVMVSSEITEPNLISINKSIKEIIFGHQIEKIAINSSHIKMKYKSIEIYKLTYDYTYNVLRKKKM